MVVASDTILTLCQTVLVWTLLNALLTTPGMANSDCPSGCYCRTISWSDGGPGTKQVSCQDNNWNSVTDGGSNYPADVEDLSFVGNKLSKLDKDAMADLKQLRTLYLARNSFKTFDTDTLNLVKSFPRLKAIDLSENPWDCSCTDENKNFIVWISSKKGPRSNLEQNQWIAFINGYNFVCFSPLELKGKRIDQLTMKDICPR